MIINYKAIGESQYPSVLRSGIVFNYIMTLVLSFVELTPYLSRNTSGTFQLAIFFLWFFSLFCISDYKELFNSKLFLIPTMILLCQLVMLFIGLSNVSFFSLVLRSRLYYIPLGMQIMLSTYSKKSSGQIAYWIACIYLFNLFFNIYLFQFGIVSNTISLGDATLGASARHTNAGDTSFCFLVSLFILYSVFLITKGNVKEKLCGAILIVSSALYLFFLNSRAISIIILMISAYVYLCQLFVTNRKHISKGFRLIIILLLSIALLYNLSLILSLLGSVKGNDWMGDKMRDLGVVLSGGGLGTHGSLAIRFTLYGYALNSWFSTPLTFLIGIGEHSFVTASRYYLKIVGISGHSDIFDYAAQYGILGLYLLFRLYCGAFGEIQKYARTKKVVIVIVAVMFVMYGFLNRFTYGNIFVAVFLLGPMYLKSISKIEDL